MIDQWALEKLESLRNEAIILLHDPQRMVSTNSAQINQWAEKHKFAVIFPSGNLGFRDQYEQIRETDGLKLILVDRTREKDGKKGKLPLFYPDLDARCKPKARLKLTLRDLLSEKTGDAHWPPMVNDRSLSRLILQNLDETLDAYAHLRKADPQRFTDSDLYKIVLDACLGINPFKSRLRSDDIRSLCVERHGQIEEVRSLLASSGVEAEDVLGILSKAIKRADKPWCWMLEHDAQDVVRGFTLACILHQHGLDYSVLLSNFDHSMKRYSDIEEATITSASQDLLASNPDGLARDVESVEEFLKDEPDNRLAFLLNSRLQVDSPENAKTVLLAEKLSPLIRSVCLLSLLADLLTSRSIDFHKSVLKAIDIEGDADESEMPLAARRRTTQWSKLLLTYRRTISYFEIAGVLKKEAHAIKVKQADELTFEQFHQLWTQKRADRHDYYSTQLQRLLKVGDLCPISSDQMWPSLRKQWDQAKPKLEDAITEVQANLNVLNSKFQDLYRAKYPSWITSSDSPVIFTHQFIPRFLKPHWHYTNQTKAVILIFDGLRTDAWEEIVRPVLEEQFDIVESEPASAILPSETWLSRNAIAAGCMPANFTATTENKLLEAGLKEHLDLDVKFKVVIDDDDRESGISVRYQSDLIDYVVFSFTDKNLHNTKDALAMVYEHKVRAIVQEDVRSILRELPKEVQIFVTSDHGFTPITESEFEVDEEKVHHNSDVKFRVGRLRYPLDDKDAKSGIMFKADEMLVPVESKKKSSTFKQFLFPRPGITLKRPIGAPRTERYTHGGLSMAECLIPLHKLEPKVSIERPFELTGIDFEGNLSEGETVDILVTATATKPNGMLFSDEVDSDILFRLSADLSDVQPRKEVFSGAEQEYRIRWKPDTSAATADEQSNGKMLRHVTVIAEYRWKDAVTDSERKVKSTIHREVEITLDTSRIRRRLDSKLDSIMGLVPKELR